MSSFTVPYLLIKYTKGEVTRAIKKTSKLTSSIFWAVFLSPILLLSFLYYKLLLQRFQFGLFFCFMQEDNIIRHLDYITAFRLHYDLYPGWVIEVWEGGIAVWFLSNLVTVFPTEGLSSEEFVERLGRLINRMNFKVTLRDIVYTTIIESNPFHALTGNFPARTKEELLRRIRGERRLPTD